MASLASAVVLEAASSFFHCSSPLGLLRNGTTTSNLACNWNTRVVCDGTNGVLCRGRQPNAQREDKRGVLKKLRVFTVVLNHSARPPRLTKSTAVPVKVQSLKSRVQSQKRPSIARRVDVPEPHRN